MGCVYVVYIYKFSDYKYEILASKGSSKQRFISWEKSEKKGKKERREGKWRGGRGRAGSREGGRKEGKVKEGKKERKKGWGEKTTPQCTGALFYYYICTPPFIHLMY